MKFIHVSPNVSNCRFILKYHMNYGGMIYLQMGRYKILVRNIMIGYLTSLCELHANKLLYKGLRKFSVQRLFTIGCLVTMIDKTVFKLWMCRCTLVMYTTLAI